MNYKKTIYSLLAVSAAIIGCTLAYQNYKKNKPVDDFE